MEPLWYSVWGDSSVMGLGALHRHCRLPATAAALLGVLLYTALVASHIVSQATPRVLIGAHGATAQAAMGDADCHESLHSAANTNDANRGVPAPPAKKCPFCAGYAALHLSVVGPCVDVPLGEAASRQFGVLGSAQLISSANLPSWHPRAPPALG